MPIASTIAHAFLSRETGMCVRAYSIGWLVVSLRSITIDVISRSFICLWTAVMWEKPTAQPSWDNGSVNGRHKRCAGRTQQKRRQPLPPTPTFGHKSRKKSKQPKSSAARLPARMKGLDSLIDNARRFILLMCWKRSEVSHLPNVRACVCPKRFLTLRGPLQANLWPFAIVRRRETDDTSQTAALRWLYRDSL